MRWWRWLLSGKKGDLLFINLVIITNAISKIGIDIKKADGINCKASEEVFIDRILISAMKAPKKLDPPSPINIFDG